MNENDFKSQNTNLFETMYYSENTFSVKNTLAPTQFSPKIPHRECLSNFKVQ